jgi:hypothetical protein
MKTVQPAANPAALSGQAKPAMWGHRIAFAFAFTPLLAPFYAAVLFGRPWALPIGLALSYPTALLIGVPIVALLLRRRWTGWWAFVATGIFCTVPVVVAYAWVPGALAEVEAFSMLNGAIVIAWGAFSGFCFWLLGVAGDSPVTLRTILTAGYG